MTDITELYPETQKHSRKAAKDGQDKGQDSEQDALRAKLAGFISEHRDLDEVIARLDDNIVANQLQMKRLKKRKLGLKDEIARLRASLLPDIIA